MLINKVHICLYLSIKITYSDYTLAYKQWNCMVELIIYCSRKNSINNLIGSTKTCPKNHTGYGERVLITGPKDFLNHAVYICGPQG